MEVISKGVNKVKVNIMQGNIEIEQHSNGLWLAQEVCGENVVVTVSYPDDALAIIEALYKILATHYPEYLHNMRITVPADTKTEYVLCELCGKGGDHMHPQVYQSVHLKQSAGR